MSYCVNCGVKLEASLTECPLCNTPVVNPNELVNTRKKVSPYPTTPGQVELVKRKDLAILLSIVLVATAICCSLLNLLVFTGSSWSLSIIGACLVLFVFAIPAVIYTKLPIYCSLLFDGIVVAVYLYLLTFITLSTHWFWGLALPIVVLVTVIAELFAFSLRSFPITYITTALYFFTAVALLCIGLELLIDQYLGAPLSLIWSAIVLTVCGVIDIMLITVLSRKRLRDAVRRRLHF